MKYKRIVLLLVISQFLNSSISSGQKKDIVYTISTREGNIVLLLYDQTPLHKNNFYNLSKKGYYNGTTFHRIIKNFMIQGGDPNSKDTIKGNEGMGGPGYTIPAEIVPGLKHIRGAVAAARLGDAQNPLRASSGSQFYIVQNPNGTPHLDNGYTVFGQVVEGLEIVDKIALLPKDFNDRPVSDLPMKIDFKKRARKKIIKKYHCESFYLK